MGFLQWLGGALAFVAGLVVLIKLFQKEGILKGILGLICMLYTYIWGWLNVKNESLNLRTWMYIWTAAIVVEPIQGEGGYIVPPDSFLQRIERICRRHGILLVADEVQFLDNPASPPILNIEGTASNVQATSVVVSGQTVQLNGFTVYTLNGAPTTSASLVNGLYVEIVATRNASVLTAQSVEIKSPGSTTTRVRGLVSGRTPANATQFMVGNQRVSVAGNPMLVPGNKTLADIVNGSDIEVDGTVAGGILNATRIKFR